MGDQSPARPAWVIARSTDSIRIVRPAEPAAAAEAEISCGWREVAERDGLEGVVEWALDVGERHGWPLSEDWVRSTFRYLMDA